VKLNTAPAQDRSIVEPRVWFQTKEILEESDRREDSKESLTEMNKDRKMQNPIRGEMVQRNSKVMKETMKEMRSRET